MSELVNQPTSVPSRKVSAAGVAGALTLVLVYLVNQFTGVEITAEVSAALTTLIAFAGGYFTKEAL